MNLKTCVLALLGCLLAGCASQSESEEPPLTPAAGMVPAAERAIDAVAAARCEQEQRCDGIGPNRLYVNDEHCFRVMQADGQSELGVCRLGIDQADLRECVAEIQSGDCSAPLDKLERVAACRSAELCVE